MECGIPDGTRPAVCCHAQLTGADMLVSCQCGRTDDLQACLCSPLQYDTQVVEGKTQKNSNKSAKSAMQDSPVSVRNCVQWQKTVQTQGCSAAIPVQVMRMHVFWNRGVCGKTLFRIRNCQDNIHGCSQNVACRGVQSAETGGNQHSSHHRIPLGVRLFKYHV